VLGGYFYFAKKLDTYPSRVYIEHTLEGYVDGYYFAKEAYYGKR
jgi:hypothetical protein